MSIDSQSSKEKSYSNLLYSDKRLDLLVFAIAGGGIYTCLETIKFGIEHSLGLNFILLKVSAFVFLLSIALNFASQIFGRLANKYDYLMWQADEQKDKKLAKEYDCKSTCFDGWVTVFNWASYISVFTGIVLLTIYFAQNF